MTKTFFICFMNNDICSYVGFLYPSIISSSPQLSDKNKREIIFLWDRWRKKVRTIKRYIQSYTVNNWWNQIDNPSILTFWSGSGSYPFSSVQFSRSVVSNSLWPHELRHARLPCPSPTPGVHSDSCPASRLCHPAISSSVVPFFSCPQNPPSIKVFSNESTLCMRWPKYWSFSFSIIPSKGDS